MAEKERSKRENKRERPVDRKRNRKRQNRDKVTAREIPPKEGHWNETDFQSCVCIFKKMEKLSGLHFLSFKALLTVFILPVLYLICPYIFFLELPLIS
jgi:hypothetical protein